MTRADRVRTHLSGEILREVSRSFYLSLRLLPRALRGCVSLGYLLARTSDTIADAPGLGSCERLELLEAMRAVVRGEGEREVFCRRLRNEVAPVVEHRGEAELLLHCDGCLDWLGSLGARQGGHVRGVFEEIIRGQMLDVERFPDASVLRALSTAGELEEYTYLVAGSVGSFWTEVCVDELGENVFAEDRETMIARGVAYGKG
ncbi:MAG: squalene/phytoene synthase family protein, partial [Verrucomicrobiales bacterium]